MQVYSATILFYGSPTQHSPIELIVTRTVFFNYMYVATSITGILKKKKRTQTQTQIQGFAHASRHSIFVYCLNVYASCSIAKFIQEEFTVRCLKKFIAFPLVLATLQGQVHSPLFMIFARNSASSVLAGIKLQSWLLLLT